VRNAADSTIVTPMPNGAISPHPPGGAPVRCRGDGVRPGGAPHAPLRGGSGLCHDRARRAGAVPGSWGGRMERRWLVTGCSSGLGRAVAVAAAEAGDLVVASARRLADVEELERDHPGRVTAVALDVCDPAQCEAAVAHAVDRFGGVDVLVNNAGAGLLGTVEEVSDDELRAQLDVLVVAPWRLTRLVLPLMRGQGAGHVVNVSSLAGRMAFPGLSAYVAGKYALEGMSQALAAEAAAFGIRVTVVEPGAFATRYGASLVPAATPIDAYTEVTREMREGLRSLQDNPAFGRPEVFAAQVLRLVSAEQPTPLRVPVGADAYAFTEASEKANLREFEAARAFVMG
jgi:NAD(P)-dependent dehydrogenase (short-subunit alcohol dehydrogenase family)